MRMCVVLSCWVRLNCNIRAARAFTCGSSLPFDLYGLMLLQGGTQKQRSNVMGTSGEGMHSSAQCLPETLQRTPTHAIHPRDLDTTNHHPPPSPGFLTHLRTDKKKTFREKAMVENHSHLGTVWEGCIPPQPHQHG